jgi:hypothetical protein
MDGKELKSALLSGVAALALGAGLLVPAAEAQTTVQQTAGKLDAATFYLANTRTSCSTTQDTVANLTLTISPPAGNYVYLTGLYFEVAPNATASTSAVVWSSTNLTGSPAWLTNTTTAAAANPSTQFMVSEVYPTAIKSTVAGTNVTIVPQTTAASAFVCVHAVGYFSP